MVSKRLIPPGLMIALLATWAMLPQSAAQSPAQEPAGQARPFYQQFFGSVPQNQTASKGADKAGSPEPVEPPAGIPLKKPAAIPLPRRSASPIAALQTDPAANKATQGNGAATDKASVQKAIDLINRTYRADDGSSGIEDRPTDLERQMLAPFLPGAAQGKIKENGSRTASEGSPGAASGSYGQGTIQVDDSESNGRATQEKPKRALGGSWFGQGKPKATNADMAPADGRSQDLHSQGNAAWPNEQSKLRIENKRPTVTSRPALAAQSDRQTMAGSMPGASASGMLSQIKAPEGTSTPGKIDGGRAVRAEPARAEKSSTASGFFFPSRWFGPARKQEASAQTQALAKGSASRKEEFASQPVSRPTSGSGLTQVSYDSTGLSIPAAFPGELAMQNQPPAPRSQYNETFPGPTSSQGDGPELPQPYPSARQPLPRGSAEADAKGYSNGTGNPSGRSPKPSLSGRGEMLPFPEAGNLGALNSAGGNESARGARSPSSGSGYQGAQDIMRVPPGGFAESEMATEPDGSLELPAPRLANAPEAKIRGLIQALAEERQKIAAPKKDSHPLKEAGLDENQRLKWRIELAMEKVMAEKNRGPGYDATRDGNPTGPIGIDLWERARSYYDRGDFVAAMETLRALEKTETRGELIMPARFLLASCLVQSGRADDASKILRELAATPNDRVIANLAQWRLSQIRSRIQLEKTLEEVRAKSLRLAEIQN